MNTIREGDYVRVTGYVRECSRRRRGIAFRVAYRRHGNPVVEVRWGDRRVPLRVFAGFVALVTDADGTAAHRAAMPSQTSPEAPDGQ